LFGEVVEGGYIGVVMVFVVEFHDFTGDGGLEGAVVVCGGGLDIEIVAIGIRMEVKLVWKLERRTWEVGQSSFSTDERGACESCSRDGGGRCPGCGAQGGCAEESGIHFACTRCFVLNWMSSQVVGV
jgi:hypothetical protein